MGHSITNHKGCPPDRRMGFVWWQSRWGTGCVGAPAWRHQRWFGDSTPRSFEEFQILAGKWSRCFQFRPEASCAFAHLWYAICSSAPQQPTLDIVLELLVAICFLLLLRCHMRCRVSPLVIAADASENGFGVVRSSTLTLESSDKLTVTWSTAVACDQMGIIELNACMNGLRRSVELLERIFGTSTASEDDPASCRVLEKRGPLQSGSHRSPPFGPLSPHLTSQSD